MYMTMANVKPTTGTLLLMKFLKSNFSLYVHVVAIPPLKKVGIFGNTVA